MTRPVLVAATAESLHALIVEERIPDTEVVIACILAKHEGITGPEILAAMDELERQIDRRGGLAARH